MVAAAGLAALILFFILFIPSTKLNGIERELKKNGSLTHQWNSNTFNSNQIKLKLI